MWRVTVDFADLQDGGYVYHVGDPFPRDGEVSPDRLAELSSSNNSRGVPLIEKRDPTLKPRRNKKAE